MNVLFLAGKIKSEPEGDTIYNIQTNWKNNYNKLERHHGYIQWLFPIETQGLNEYSQPLSKAEINVSCN